MTGSGPVTGPGRAPTRIPEVALLGARGFGAVHLRNVRRLEAAGRVRLTALVDPVLARGGSDLATTEATPVFDDLRAAVATVGTPDVVVIAAPIPAHLDAASTALRLDADVLLEKPPLAGMHDFETLLALEQETGGVVQVGFQSLGSDAVDALRRLAEPGGLGPVVAVRARGTWTRRASYWSRAPWAGRRTLDGVDVVDGVVTNPLAHAVATALTVAGTTRAEQVAHVEVELYRANAIDADDTSSLRVMPHRGPTVTAALTLCAAEDRDPVVEVVHDRGTASFDYESDTLVVDGPTGRRTERYARTDLLEDLLDHRTTGRPLRVPLGSTGAFMRVVEAVRASEPPRRIEPRWITWRDVGNDPRPVVHDVERWVRAATDAGRLFSEVGAPWAQTGGDTVLGRAEVDGRTVMTLIDGAGTTATSVPRPTAHPVRTLAGVEVTAQHPADHDWHVGLGLAVPDVDGSNFWGGPTFVRDRGYELRDDHGRMVATRSTPVVDGRDGTHGLDQRIEWRDQGDRIVLRETRAVRWWSLRPEPSAWALAISSTLAAARPVSLGSPGTNGRTGAGYGGFFWRFPPCRDVSVRSAEADGADAVHGSVSPWVAWTAHFAAGPGRTGDATVVLVPDDTSTEDPWFVRVDEYPALGTAVAWDARRPIAVDDPLRRGLRAAVVDGRLTRPEIARIVEAL